MKKTFIKTLISILAVTSLITLSSCSEGIRNLIHTAPSPTPEPGPFVDKYVFENLLDKTISYDLDGDGNEDMIKFDRYEMYSQQMGDYCARYDCIINNEKYHLFDTRHGIYERVFITDLDPTDKYLDIVMLCRYKSLTADIFRYDGNDVFELLQPSGSGETMELFTTISTVRDQSKLDELIDNVEIQIPESPEDKNEFTFVCGDESFTYRKVSDGVYEEK